MFDFFNFKKWLRETYNYTERTIGNVVSRIKRADNILPIFLDEFYCYKLERCDEYITLCPDVKSQIKKSIKLFLEYNKNVKNFCNDSKYNLLSLFSNIGVAEAYLEEIGFTVAVANEIVERRADLYSKIYPGTNMICGDITNEFVKEKVIKESIKSNVDIVIATPPCQGMSTAGQQKEDDYRNYLICPVIDIVKKIMPKYIFIENVPLFLNTAINVCDEKMLIIDYIRKELSVYYNIDTYVIDTSDYSVPQFRERAIILISRKDVGRWAMPSKDEKKITLMDAIGKLPKLDPYISDVTNEEMIEIFPHFYERKEAALKISKWHNPPSHIKRQVIAMQHTPTGMSAFDNPIYYPKKEDGTPVKGFKNTYKRQNWDTPAYTVTMDNRKISSQNNVHPGRLEKKDEHGDLIFSDPRTLTLYEIMIISTLPKNWPIPDDTSEAFLRRIIGEGIPPLFLKKVFLSLKEMIENE